MSQANNDQMPVRESYDEVESFNGSEAKDYITGYDEEEGCAEEEEYDEEELKYYY